MNRSLILAAALITASCTSAPPPPLKGAKIGGPFALIDENGKAATDRDFAGRYRIVYFGYTFCPDVCPTDVATLARALRTFEAKAADRASRIVPIFVTVDPARDTPAVVREFTAQFHPRMIGLTGSPAAIAAAAKAYGVAYSAQKPNAQGAYLVDHSNIAYLMAPDGAPITLLPADQGAEAVVAALDQWVR